MKMKVSGGWQGKKEGGQSTWQHASQSSAVELERGQSRQAWDNHFGRL